MVRTPCSGPSNSDCTCVLHEGVVGAVAPAQVLAVPAVVEVRRCTRRCPTRCRGGRAAACGRARRARPGRSSPRLPVRVVVEAAHAGVGAVVVVEGAVLLHQEDDVLDGAEVRAGRLGARRRPGHGGARPAAVAPAGRGQHRRAAGRQRGGEQGAAVEARRASAAHWRVPGRCPTRHHRLDERRVVVAHVADARPDGVVHDRAGGRWRAAGRAAPRRPRWPGRARGRRWRGRGCTGMRSWMPVHVRRRPAW